MKGCASSHIQFTICLSCGQIAYLFVQIRLLICLFVQICLYYRVSRSIVLCRTGFLESITKYLGISEKTGVQCFSMLCKLRSCRQELLAEFSRITIFQNISECKLLQRELKRVFKVVSLCRMRMMAW